MIVEKVFEILDPKPILERKGWTQKSFNTI